MNPHRSILGAPNHLAPGIDLLGVGQRNTIETATPRHAWITTGRWRGERIELTAGASNLLDAYPDESENANDFFGNFAFDPINPIGLNGRFVYL